VIQLHRFPILLTYIQNANLKLTKKYLGYCLVQQQNYPGFVFFNRSVSIKTLRDGRSPKLLDPDRISDWISIEDIASALVFAMRNSLPEVIDVGSGIGTTNRELANWIIEISGAQISDSGTSKTCLEAKGLVVSKESPVFQAGWHPWVNLRTYLAQTY
jgi:nucleoside-diphosphate-sugar epimerase